jgi:hypothetical protein
MSYSFVDTSSVQCGTITPRALLLEFLTAPAALSRLCKARGSTAEKLENLRQSEGLAQP